MKRPITVVLLLSFALAELYFGKGTVPSPPPLAWMRLAPHPAQALVVRQGTYRLVTSHHSYALAVGRRSVTARPGSLKWIDVPEPSGQGVWRLAVGHDQVALAGADDTVYPAPNGKSVIWRDPGTGLLYRARSGEPPRLGSAQMTAVSDILWAANSRQVVLAGNGPQGYGLYLWTQGRQPMPVNLHLSTRLPVVGLGFGPHQSLLAAFNDGRLWWQGHGMVPLGPLRPLALDTGQPSVLGIGAGRAVFWHDGKQARFLRIDAKWLGHACFSPNGQRGAVLVRNDQGSQALQVYAMGSQVTVPLPFGRKTPCRLLGFAGPHWVLLSVMSGPHRGTYAHRLS
ncbi:MAG: hypothetical protein M0Z53_08970 [Thermaerobacter sp.]|nr:hypothetical protein [Thermaerobacter sp.]